MLESKIRRPIQAPVPFGGQLRRLFYRQRRPTARGRGATRPLHWMWKNAGHQKISPYPVMVKMRKRTLKAQMLAHPNASGDHRSDTT